MILVKNLQKDGKFPTSIRELGFKKFRTSKGQRESRGNRGAWEAFKFVIYSVYL